MVEEDDPFYDSLDEMSEFHSSLKNPRSSDQEGSTSCLFVSNVTEADSCISSRIDDDCDVCSMIPLYDGEVQKDERKQNKKRTKKKPKGLEILDKSNNKNRSGNSYVALFHSRIGYPSERTKRTIPDSARALDGDVTQRTIGELENNNTADVFEDAQEEAADDTER